MKRKFKMLMMCLLMLPVAFVMVACDREVQAAGDASDLDKGKLIDILELTEDILAYRNTDFTVVSAQQVNLSLIIATIDNVSPTLTQGDIDNVYNMESVKLQINHAKFMLERDEIMRDIGPANRYTADSFRVLMEALLDVNRNISDEAATLYGRLTQIDSIMQSLVDLHDAKQVLQDRDPRASHAPQSLSPIALVLMIIFFPFSLFFVLFITKNNE